MIEIVYIVSCNAFAKEDTVVVDLADAEAAHGAVVYVAKLCNFTM